MQNQAPVLIRVARREDGATILSMLAELAAWECAPHAPRLSPSTLESDVFGKNPKLHILVAENQSKQLVGFISYYENYSSWEGAVGIHIGDLWVSPACRWQSVGSDLLNHVASSHKEQRVDVFVIRNNEARFFYEHLGFKGTDTMDTLSKGVRMLFMIVERFKNGDPKPIRERFTHNGRMMTDDLVYHSSWIDAENARCFQVMEAASAEMLNAWTSCWDDLIDFEIIPVLSSHEYWARFQ